MNASFDETAAFFETETTEKEEREREESWFFFSFSTTHKKLPRRVVFLVFICLISLSCDERLSGFSQEQKLKKLPPRAFGRLEEEEREREREREKERERERERLTRKQHKTEGREKEKKKKNYASSTSVWVFLREEGVGDEQ